MNDTVPCPVCSTPFTRVRRQRYCSDLCRRTAWRRRHTDTPPAIAVPKGRTKRETTVYECTDCGTRMAAEQWCSDCNRPAARVGLGGACPHCDEPVTVDELLGTEPAATVSARKGRDGLIGDADVPLPF